MRFTRLCGLAMACLLSGNAWADGCHLIDYGTIPVNMVNMRATTLVKINGTDTPFIIDTGAWFNTMSKATATALGLKLEEAPFGLRIVGIGGSASAEQAHVKAFGILDTTLKNVDFIVGGTDTGDGLLGAYLLDYANLEIDLAHGKMKMFKTEHCDKAALAYWVTDGNYNQVDLERPESSNDKRSFVDVTINGKKVRALIDSGAHATVLSRAAAERVGIDLHAPGVKEGGAGYGLGAKMSKTWIVPVASFSVGTETIQHSQMQVIDTSMPDRSTDMLLGVDFLLAHRMFIDNDKRKIYFTYNGGRVFTYADAPGDASAPAAASTAPHDGTAPTTADEYAMSGQAQLSRGEAAAAVADLDQAIHLAPDNAAFYVSRASAHAANHQADAALADVDKALTLDPKNADALLMRAEHRLSIKDRSGAAADVTAARAVVPAGSTRARLLASLYVRLDQPADALPILDDWIRLHGDDARLGSALNERCWARALGNQQLDDALKDCRKAIRRDGPSAPYLDSLGLVELRLAQYADSIKAYEQSLALNPKSAWSHYGLGLAKIHAGQLEAGRADLATAHTLDPHVEGRAASYGLVAPTP